MKTTGSKLILEPIFETPSATIAVPDRPSRWKNGKLSICGRVVSAGPGTRNRKGLLIPTEVKVGDYVYHSDSCGTPILNGRYNVVREADVMFVTDEPIPAQWLGAKENYDE